MSRRYEDWPSRLTAYLYSCEARPFEWGSFDCALFAAGGIDAMTGLGVQAKYLGTYNSALGAARLMPNGFRGLIRELAAEWGFVEISAGYIQRGDAVLVQMETSEALGICVGAQVALASIHGGVTYYPMTAAILGWRIA